MYQYREFNPLVTGVERATSLKILGVIIGERLTIAELVCAILWSCSSSLYALRTLWDQGMPSQAMFVVTQATSIARLLYASPAWWTLLSAAEHGQLERFLRWVVQAGCLPENAPSVDCILGAADHTLFRAIRPAPHLAAALPQTGVHTTQSEAQTSPVCPSYQRQ